MGMRKCTQNRGIACRDLKSRRMFFIVFPRSLQINAGSGTGFEGVQKSCGRQLQNRQAMTNYGHSFAMTCCLLVRFWQGRIYLIQLFYWHGGGLSADVALNFASADYSDSAAGNCRIDKSWQNYGHRFAMTCFSWGFDRGGFIWFNLYRSRNI